MIEIKERVKIPGEVEPVIEYETRLHTLSNGHCRPKIAVDRLDVRVLLSTLGWERDRAALREAEALSLQAELISYGCFIEDRAIEIRRLNQKLSGQTEIIDGIKQLLKNMKHDEEIELRKSGKKNFSRLEMLEAVSKKILTLVGE